MHAQPKRIEAIICVHVLLLDWLLLEHPQQNILECTLNLHGLHWSGWRGRRRNLFTHPKFFILNAICIANDSFLSRAQLAPFWARSNTEVCSHTPRAARLPVHNESADLSERRAGEIDELSLATYLLTYIATYLNLLTYLPFIYLIY